MRLLTTMMLLILSLWVRSQDFSNRGTDFWLGYGNHVRMFVDNSQRMVLYVSATEATNYRVEIPGLGWSFDGTVAANGVSITPEIPKAGANDARLVSEGKSNRGIHLTSDKPVVAYVHIYDENVSGAGLLFPTQTLGREYVSVNYTQKSNRRDSYSWFYVVAAENNTRVEITPTKATLGGRAAGATFSVDLNQGEVYHVLANEDLTGSRIRSVAQGTEGCKRVAVFSGSGMITIAPGENQTADNLIQQVFPIPAWGRKYITTPTGSQPNNFFRILRSDPGAVVQVNGAALPDAAFTNGFAEIGPVNQVNLIESDKPILVAQYTTSQNNYGNTGIGDPEMIFLSPVEQTIDQVSLYCPSTFDIRESFINVVIKTSSISSFRLDGAAVSFQPVSQDPSYSYAIIPVARGVHVLRADSGFNAITYGFGPAESWGYNAGTNVRDLYQFISVLNTLDTIDQTETCRNSPFRLQVTLPYRPLSMQVDFGNVFPGVSLPSPIPDSSYTRDGRTLYVFRLPNSYVYPNIGNFPVKVTLQTPGSEGCNGLQELDFVMRVYDRPFASFRWEHSGCLEDPVRFLDSTEGYGKLINRWYWQFGNGDTALRTDPVYTYLQPGDKNVLFYAGNDIGCKTDDIQRVLPLTTKPVADFLIDGQPCAFQQLTLLPQGTVQGGQITRLAWEVIRGNLVATLDSADWGDYVLPLEGAMTMTIRMTPVSNSGCVGTVQQKTVDIRNAPVAEFIVPSACVNDRNILFRDSSYFSDGSNQPITWSWDFGDGQRSNLQNPTVTYSRSGTYDVQLVVNGQGGCADTLVKPVLISGNQLTATYTLLNTGPLCSNEPVRLRLNSSVDVGRIIRIEIYWDFLSNPINRTVLLNPEPDATATFRYDPFSTPATRTVRILMRAYSGESCFIDYFADWTLQAGPSFVLDALPVICEGDAPLPVPLRTKAGLTGTGVWSGNHVSAEGIFSPASAGPGTHSLTYSFTSSSGCQADTTLLLTVNARPVVSAGPDRAILANGQVTLQATDVGNGNTYVWSPANGLSSTGVLRPVASPTAETLYTLTATSSAGCVTTDDVWVRVIPGLKIPNTFTPNNDGINDRWEIQFLDSFEDCVVEVYNPRGQLLFRSVGYRQPWDGTHQGRILPVGTYYYAIHPKNGARPITGYVTILR